MNAAPRPVSMPADSAWRSPALIAAASILALVALFWPTFHSMTEIWARSDTYAHGYLVFPISLWLLWRRRADLARVTPVADPRGLTVLAAAGAVWLLADAGSVSVAAQYAFVAMLLAMVWTVLGGVFVRAALFPLLFLLFAVPVGEFLIPPLMEFTADFTVAAVKLAGIPVYREGNYFSLPSGDWSVVEACSGLRYLIASVTLGALYAYLTYRTWKLRLLFAVAAIAVPILANGLRATMIVMIGHLSGMKYAVGVDHLLYGWVFFGVVMLLLFWVGNFWREDELPYPLPRPAAAPARTHSFAAVAVAALLAAGLWPAWAAWLDARPLPRLPELKLVPAGGWQAAPAFTDWVPHWVGADRRLRQSYTQGTHAVVLQLDYYARQRQGAELVNSQNYMVSQSKYEHWVNVGETVETVTIDGQSRPVRQALMRRYDGRRLLVWQWNRIGATTTVDDRRAKLTLALDRLRGVRDDGASVLIATPYDEAGVELDTAKATLARFAAGMAPAIDAALDRVDGP